MTTALVPVTAILASFTEAARFTDLSATVRDRVREHIKDCIGVSVGASIQEPGQILRSLMSDFQAQGGIHIIGSNIATSPTEAAWANGALAHLLDFDDTGFSHPTACILPAALAVGELIDATGEDLILAMAIGYEVFERISRSGRKFESLARKNGLHPTSVYGCPAAAAAASSLMGLDAHQTAVAMGIACSAGGGLTEQFGTWGKGTQAGNAARAGVVSALLASRGFRGSLTMIEGEHGMMSSFLGHDNYDFTLIEAELRTAWAIEDPGLHIKPYPACGAAQNGIAAALQVRSEVVDDPNEIARIDVTATEALLHTLHIDWPTDGFQGKFSLRYCLAVAFADGDVTLESFSDASFDRPLVQTLLRAINVEVLPGYFTPSPEQRRLPVTVTLRDGRTATALVETYLGHAKNPMSLAQITMKYMTCVAGVLSHDQANRSSELLDSLESITIRELMQSVALGE